MQISKKIKLKVILKKVSKNFIKVINFFLLFFLFWREPFHFFIDPTHGPIFFSSDARAFKFLGHCYVRQLPKKKKKKIQMWMIIFNKTKLQMNEMPVHFQEWGSNHKWIMATAELEQTQDDPAEAKATIGLIWH